MFREIVISHKKSAVGFESISSQETISLDKYLPGYATAQDNKEGNKVGPDDIRFSFQQFGGKGIVIIDEFDRVKDNKTTTQFADTVKTLSDNLVEATIIFVGVADSIVDLISEHASIERTLIPVRIPRMSDRELLEILDIRFNRLSIEIERKASMRIIRLSQGLPHYTHLLGVHAAQHAVDNFRLKIEVKDVEAAIRVAIEDTPPHIMDLYHKATRSAHSEALYEEVLLACALSETDSLGFFSPAKVRDPMSAIMESTYDIPRFAKHLQEFCVDKRGPILERKGEPRRYVYRFINPLIQPFTILHGLANRKVTESILEELSDSQNREKSLFD